MPIVSGGGGGGTPFNGGTITSPLQVALTSNPGEPGRFEDSIGNGLFTNTASVLEWDTASADLLSFGGAGSFFYVGATRGVYFLNLTTAPADGVLAAGGCSLWFDQTNGAAKLMVKAKQADGTVVAPGLTGRDLATAPAVSAASTLALGTAYQNTLGYDVLLCVYLSVTVNTSGVLKLGVGPTTTPTQQTLVTGITATGLWPVPIYLPNQYYALLSVTGTITVAVDGQIAMPV